MPVAHQLEVVILQHPLEATNPKGSARLLHLCLPRSRLYIGESWPADTLHAMLNGPLDAFDAFGVLHQAAGDVGKAHAPKQVLLLYPDTDHVPALAQAPGAPNAPRGAPWGAPHTLRLVVLDGTWRKSLKMLHLNPALQQLPRLALQHLPASRYRIRQAHQPDQRSTFEAACAAMAQLEPLADHSTTPHFSKVLLGAFDRFIAQQIPFSHGPATHHSG